MGFYEIDSSKNFILFHFHSFPFYAFNLNALIYMKTFTHPCYYELKLQNIILEIISDYSEFSSFFGNLKHIKRHVKKFSKLKKIIFSTSK